jgi:hypothetical protein
MSGISERGLSIAPTKKPAPEFPVRVALAIHASLRILICFAVPVKHLMSPLRGAGGRVVEGWRPNLSISVIIVHRHARAISERIESDRFNPLG